MDPTETTGRPIADVHRVMADLSPALMWLTDMRGRCVHVNQRWLEFTGRRLEEESGDGWMTGIHRDDIERCQREFTAHLSDLKAFTTEYRLRRHDGIYRWVFDQGTPWFDEHGAFAGYVGSCFDIHERKATESALESHEARWKAVIDTSAAVVFVLGRDGRYLLVNQEWQRVFNPTGRLVVGRTLDELLPPDAVERSQADNLRVFELGERVVGEQTIVIDGHEHVFLVNKVPVREHSGEITALCGIAIDVSEGRHAERARLESERRLQAILDYSPVFVIVTDREHRFLQANRRWKELFAPPGVEVIGKRIRDVFPLSVAENSEASNDGVWASGEPLEVERTPEIDAALSQGILYRLVKFLLRDERGEPYALCTIGMDITDRVRGEEERRRIEKQIMHAQKLESLGVLAGGIAHDFNNLLVGVLGNAGLAMSEVPMTSPAYSSLRQIETAAMRAADLTRQMLAYSGKGRFIVQPLDLSAAVEEMIGLLQSVISKRAVMRFDLAKGLPAIEADATQIRQITMNLITNASDAIGDRSGVIMVRTGMMHADAAYLRDSMHGDDLTPGPYAYVEVSDNGIGMDRETQQRIFDPFFSTKFTGRGLGLAAVLGIVRGHRGAIRLYSEPGKGSNFKALFPTTDRAIPDEDRHDERRVGFRGEGSVLVVDDDETVRTVARMALERVGFTIIEAEDGRAGLAAYKAHSADIRLVLLDLTMPHMGGEEALRELRAISPELPVVLMSGYNSQEVTTQFVGHGVAGFLQKPFRIPALLSTVQEILEAKARKSQN
jgi:PAS domain S-box-containing protein